MADPEVVLTAGDGWRELVVGGVRGLLPQHLTDPVAAAVDRLADAETVSLEDVLDALVVGGVRGMPDLALVQGRRVVVRGTGRAVAGTGVGDEAADDETRAHETLAHEGRGPWTEVDLGEDIAAVELRAGETPAAEAATGQQRLSLIAGWRPPSALEGAAAVVRGSAPDEPDHEGGRPEGALEDDEPVGESASDLDSREVDVPSEDGGEGDRPEDDGPGNDNEHDVPDYDFLFGDTQMGRPDPPAAPAPDEVEAAAGVTRDEPGSETILPEHDDADDHLEDDAAAGSPAKPTPSAESSIPSSPTPASGVISSVPWARSGGADQPAPPPSPQSPPPPSPASPPTDEPTTSPDDAAEPDGAVDPGADTTGRDALMAQAATVDGPKVLAVICPAGHLSPPHLDVCRVCARAMSDQQAFEAARPALGVLRLDSGDEIPLDRGVLLGRSPKAKPDLDVARQPHVVRLPSPDNDLSRNHLEIILDGWHVLARDLGSTNGTTVQLPGAAPTRLRPEEQLTLEPGSVLVLADSVSVTFEVPR
ncbi:FHA domain-containing protein [Marihabitans asiaticum]|uniref:FHA domain-containing protein n=1 Tax=Marihabitans asiaticum TaxID=415218 RepID=A0A560WG81_9MICO|nr:FHA domain-containing protein [Marihabitans asiaticum]TWD16556.1 FHA domain-containing protein [Marihabitans asiaticum]